MGYGTRIHSEVSTEQRIKKQVARTKDGGKVALIKHQERLVCINTYEDRSAQENGLTEASIPLAGTYGDNIVNFTSSYSPITGKTVRQTTVKNSVGTFETISVKVEVT